MQLTNKHTFNSFPRLHSFLFLDFLLFLFFFKPVLLKRGIVAILVVLHSILNKTSARLPFLFFRVQANRLNVFLIYKHWRVICFRAFIIDLNRSVLFSNVLFTKSITYRVRQSLQKNLEQRTLKFFLSYNH